MDYLLCLLKPMYSFEKNNRENITYMSLMGFVHFLKEFYEFRKS